MHLAFDLTEPRETDIKRLILPVTIRILTPLIFFFQFATDNNIFNDCYFIIMVMMLVGNYQIKNTRFNSKTHHVTFAHEDFLPYLIGSVLSIFHLCFSIYHKIGFMSAVRNQKPYDATQLNTLQNKLNSKKWIFETGIFEIFFRLSILVVVTWVKVYCSIKFKDSYNHQALSSLKDLSKAVQAPLKLSIFVMIALVNFMSQPSVVTLLFIVVFVLMLLAFINIAASESVKKVNVTGFFVAIYYILLLGIIWFGVYRLLGSFITVYNNPTDYSMNDDVKKIVSDHLSKSNLVYLVYINRSIFGQRIYSLIILLWSISYYRYCKRLLSIARIYERKQFATLINKSSDSTYSELNRMGFSEIDRINYIKEGSYTDVYFAPKILEIFFSSNSKAFKHDLTFKAKYLNKLQKSDPIFKNQFEKLRVERKSQMKQWESVARPFKSNIFDFFGFLSEFIAKNAKNINYLVCMFIVYHSLDQQWLNWYEASVILFYIANFFLAPPRLLITYTKWVVTPLFLLESLYINYLGIRAKMLVPQTSFFQLLNFTQEMYRISFYLMISQVFLMVIENRKTRIKSRLNRIWKKSQETRNSSLEGKSLLKTIRQIGILIIYTFEKIKSVSRYLALGAFIYSSFLLISIPNLINAAICLFMFSRPHLDRTRWLYLMYFMALLMVGQIVVKTKPSGVEKVHFDVNVEIFALFNLRKVPETGNVTPNYLQTIFYGLLFSSLHLFSLTDRKRKLVRKATGEDVKEPTRLRDTSMGKWLKPFLKTIDNFYQNYMIWVFHSLVNLLLFTEPNKDFINYFTFLLETFMIMIHMFIWQSYTKRSLYNKLYFSWKTISYIINIMFYWRYILSFRIYSLVSTQLDYLNITEDRTAVFFIRRKDQYLKSPLPQNYIVEILLIVLKIITYLSFMKKKRSEVKQKIRTTIVARTGGNAKVKIFFQFQRPWLFTVVAVCWVSIIYIMTYYYISKNVNVIKVLLLISPTLLLLLLFSKLAGVVVTFQLRSIISHSLGFFKLNFMHSLDSNFEIRGALFTKGHLYYRDNVLYFSQLMLKMEKITRYYISRFFIYFFFPCLLYVVMLMSMVIAHNISSNYSKTSNKFMGLEISDIENDLYNMHLVLVLLLMTNLMLHFYSTLESKVTELNNIDLKRMINIIQSKVVILHNLSRLKIEAKGTDYHPRRKVDEATAKLVAEEIELKKQQNSIIASQLGSNLKAKSILSQKHSTQQKLSKRKSTSSNGKNKGKKPSTSSGKRSNKRNKIKTRVLTEEEYKVMHKDQTTYEKRTDLFIIKYNEFNSFQFNSQSHIEKFTGVPASDFAPSVIEIQQNNNETVVNQLFRKSTINSNSQINLSLKSQKSLRPSKVKNENPQEDEIVTEFMELSLSPIKRLIFFKRSQQKWSTAFILSGFDHLFKQLCILALLVSFSDDWFINVALLLLLILSVYIIKGFEKYNRFFLWLFALYHLLITFRHIFPKDLESVKPEQYFSSKNLTASQIPSILVSLLRNQDDGSDSYWWHLTLYLLISGGFASLVVATQFIFCNLFVVKLPKSQIFFNYNASTKQLDLDYKKWTKSIYSVMAVLLKVSYVSYSQIYLTYVTMVTFVMMRNQIGFLFFLFFLFTSRLVLNINRSWERVLLKLTVHSLILYIIYILLYNQLQGYGKFKKLATSFADSLGINYSVNDIFSIALMLLATMITRNILAIKFFDEDCKKFNEESELKNRISTLAYQYEVNDRKLYERVVIMQANDNLEDHIDQFLNSKYQGQIQANQNYFRTDITKDIRKVKWEFLANYYKSFSIYFMKTVEAVYDFLYSRTNTFRQVEPMLLFSHIQRKNHYLKLDMISLEDHICGNYDKTNHALDKILKFYQNFRRPEGGPTHLKEKKQARFERNMKLMEDPNFGFITKFKERYEEVLGTYQNFEQMEQYDPSREVTLQKEKIPKDPKLLKKASSILFDSLNKSIGTGAIEENSQIYDDISVFKFQKHTSIIIHNAASSDIKETSGFVLFRFRISMVIILNAFTTNLDIFMSLMLVISQLVYGGLMSMVICGILFFFINNEENQLTTFWWELILGMYQFLFLVKIFSNIYYIVHPKQDWVVGFCSMLFGVQSPWVEALSVVSVMWIIFFLRRQGVGLQNKYMYDNPALCTLRHIVNHTFQEPLALAINYEKDQIQYAAKKVMNDKSTDDASRNQIMYNHIKYIIKAERTVHKAYTSLLHNVRKLIFVTRHDTMRLENRQIKNVFWRNMAPEQRKNGVSLTLVLFISLLLLLTVVAVAYSRVQSVPAWIHESVRESELQNRVWMHLFVFLMLGSMMYFYISGRQVDRKGLQKKPLAYKFINETLNSKKKETIFEGSLHRFRRFAKQIVAVMRTFKADKKKNIFISLLQLPIFRFYLIAMLMWLYGNILVNSVMINNGRISKENDVSWKAFYCFHDRTSECHSQEQYLWVKATYFCVILQVFLMSRQICYGFPVWRSLITDFNFMEYVVFLVVHNIPLFKEIGMLIKFASTRTSLTIYNWFTIKDIEMTMKVTKFSQIKRDRQNFVNKLNIWLKRLLAVGILIVTFIVFLGPLMLFSNYQLGNTYQDIETMKIDVSIFDKNQHKIGSFFESNLILKTKLIDLDEKGNRWNFIKQAKNYYQMDLKGFREIKVSKYSQKLHSIKQTGHSVEEAATFEELLNGGFISISIDLNFQGDNRTLVWDDKQIIQASHINEVNNMITTNCSSTEVSREMFLQTVPMIFQISEDQGADNRLHIIDDPKLKKDINRKWSLGMACSSFNQTYFYISSEGEDYLYFSVLSRESKQVTKLIEENLGVQLSIYFIYYTFWYYVGIKYIRKFFFGKTTAIWYNDIPRAEVMLILVDAIEIAQFQGDLLKEDILYYFLLELLRSPEDLKSMTGDMLKHRLKIHLEKNQKKK